MKHYNSEKIGNNADQINPDINEYMDKIIKYFGSQTRLSTALDVHKQSISRWLNNKASIPLVYALKIEFLTKGRFKFFKMIDKETQSYLKKKNKSPKDKFYRDYE